MFLVMFHDFLRKILVGEIFGHSRNFGLGKNFWVGPEVFGEACSALALFDWSVRWMFLD
jgi:hypothetical protein